MHTHSFIYVFSSVRCRFFEARETLGPYAVHTHHTCWASRGGVGVHPARQGSPHQTPHTPNPAIQPSTPRQGPHNPGSHPSIPSQGTHKSAIHPSIPSQASPHQTPQAQTIHPKARHAPRGLEGGPGEEERAPLQERHAVHLEERLGAVLHVHEAEEDAEAVVPGVGGVVVVVGEA